MKFITELSIGKVKYKSFKNVSLVQNINNHHFFEIIFDQEVIEDVGGYTIDKSKAWLGESIIIVFGKKEFSGIITDITLNHSDGHNGQLIVTGYSKTILLEGGRHTCSWLGKTLASIVKDTADSAGVEAEIAPNFKAEIEYQAQYNETHFQFIQRLAKQYNEFLYYDGLKLIFGKPALAKAIDIEYGKDLFNVNISIKALPTASSMFSYNSLKDEKNESNSNGNVGGLNELSTSSLKASNKVFKIKPTVFSSARVSGKSEIDQQVKNRQAEVAASLSNITASSQKQGLGLGSVVNISSAKYENNEYVIDKYGEYIITAITHSADSEGVYMNNFEALSSGVEVLPSPQVGLPIAEAQIATVLSNEDPKKKGRVQVQFQWQKGQMKTSWIRVMSPDAGKSDSVGVNRGFVFIPEKDDTVMVGFRYNDPNRPFVMGSMFNGITGAGGDTENKTKKITTRSGSTIIFDEKEGSIYISDAKQNSITLDGKGGISVSASASITLATGSSRLSMKSDGTIDLTGLNTSIVGTDSVTASSDKVATLNGKEAANMTSATMVSIDSQGETMVSGLKKTIITSSATTEVQGTIVKLN